MTRITSSVHTHTTFCDGAATPREMVLAAIDKGLLTLGFSGHGYTEFDTSYCIKDSARYFEELFALKEEFADTIDILVGLEQDLYGNKDARAEYIIGSVHYLKVDGVYYVVDSTAAELKKCADDVFGGDFEKVVAAYYDEVAECALNLQPDILGHFDLITKFSEQKPMFDTSAKWYNDIVERTLDKIEGAACKTELNLGAMFKRYKSEPYPSTDILKRMAKRDFGLVVTNDAHCPAALGYKFDYAENLLKSIGFSSVYQLTKQGFEKIKL